MHNVLIIDDDRELCLLIKRSVLLEDIEADFCNTGKAGLQKLKEKQYPEHFDLAEAGAFHRGERYIFSDHGESVHMPIHCF